MRLGAIGRDERGIVFDWLLKFVIWFAIFGVILFDAGAIVVNAISLDSKAEEMVVVLSRDVGTARMRTLAEFEARAESLASEVDAKVVQATIDEQGDIFIKLRRNAATLIVMRFGAISEWGKGTAEAQGSTGRARPFGR